MKKEEIDCLGCIHEDICIIFIVNKDASNNYMGDIGKNNNCKNFYYKKRDMYTLVDFKEILIEKIQNTKNGYHLLIVESIFKLLEKNDEKKTK